MKKGFSLLLSLIVILSLSACSGSEQEKSMYDMYVKASESMQNVDSVSMDTTMDMAMKFGEEEMKMTMKGTISEVIRSETDIDMKLDMITSAAGQEFSTLAYYKDGTYYIDMMGQKMKMPMPLDDIVKQANVKALDFSESAIKNQSFKDLADGKELSFTLDGKAISDLLGDQLSSSLSSLLGSDSEMTFSDVELKAVISKDNIFKTVEMAFPFEMVIDGDAVQVDYKMVMEYVQFGGVTVDFPTDLDTYTSSTELTE